MSNSKDFQEPRLLPALLDHRAACQPDQAWAKFPVSPTSYDQGFQGATYSQMRNAVDSMAWFLDANIGKNNLLTNVDVPAYPYEKTFEEARNEPAFALHTSGSTGIPKPLIYTNEFVCRIYAATTLSPLDEMTRIDQHFLQGEWFPFLPAFHIAGIGFGLVLAMYSKSVPVLPLPGRPPSTDAFLEAVKYGTFNWASSFLLSSMISAKTPLPSISSLASSRTSSTPAVPSHQPPLRIADPSFTETWQYLYIHPTAQPEFRQRMDDLHELVLVRSTQNPEAQPVFAMFPGLDEYETRDLFSPHPTLPNLWRHRGRRDDIIVFLNDEKTNPVTFEQQVSRHPDVRSALVAGNQRLEACLLIEPATMEALSDAAKADLIEAVWSAVEEANAQCPAHARVSKSKILVLDAAKPMLRAGKGTVQRAGTIQLYQDEIDALYEERQIQEPPKKKLNSLQHAIHVLRILVEEVTSWSEFKNHADFFVLGIESLQALRLTAAIRSTLGVIISPSAIYTSASINGLANMVYSDSPADTGDDRMISMSRLLHRYEQQINQLASSPKAAEIAEQTLPVPQVVILTGSTGTVESFLLDYLVANPIVSHICYLNRARPNEEDPRSSQAVGNKRKNLTHALSEKKVTFLTADLVKDSLGLDAGDYNSMVSSATQIIHAARPLNFIQPLHYFKSSLAGLLNLIALTRKGRCHPSLLFLSYISAVSSHNTLPDATAWIPEDIITDPLCTAAIGYGESKYLAEDYNGSTRLEQGGKGQYDEIGWIPVDILAPILFELSTVIATGNFRKDVIEGSPGGAPVFHCVNPRRVQWKDLIPVVVYELQKPDQNGQSGQIIVVSLQGWVAKLHASTASERVGIDIDRNHAVKLVGFYEQQLTDAGRTGVARFSTDRTAEASKGLRELQTIHPEWLRGWIREWLD
ncbi:putative NRPS-like enzyme [Aspergillus affinis]|uniref:putative NRPS-like enzyme n=1 Tax=Aspergillus affinis TaxID=1070780 RepID=UPI0022FEEBD8|nr:putative NRPS-like enzyme [Aspergillus affinis]KAI9043969.1 putative NRPS-like enzyme [Aspergillus affinis]